MRFLISFTFVAVSTGAYAGSVQRFIDMHGGCKGTTYSVVDMLEVKISPSDQKFLGKSVQAWNEQDLNEFKKVYRECLEDHPGHGMASFPVGGPLIVPPGFVDNQVDDRASEIRRSILVPAEAARKAAAAQREAVEDASRQAELVRSKADQEADQARQADAKARQDREFAEAMRRRAAMEAQARRDRDAAIQAQAHAAEEAPKIALAEKEAAAAHEARMEAERSLADIRRQTTRAQDARKAEDASIALNKLQRERIEKEARARQVAKAEYDALSSSCAITETQFEKLSIGMTLFQVQKTLGCKGLLQSSTEIKGLGDIVIYHWNGTNSGGALTSFSEGRLFAKSQSRLD